MSNYPLIRPATLEDVDKAHIVGKVTEVNQRNCVWLRDALDIALAEVDRLTAWVDLIEDDRIRLAEEIERLTAALDEITKAASGFPHISKVAMEALSNE